MRLQNKVILLSGVGPRMGRASALLFAREGARVVINARRSDSVAETVAQVKAQGGEALGIPADVASAEGAGKVLAEVLRAHGRLDAVYSGAGGFFEPGRDFAKVDAAFLSQALGNTLNSAYNLAHGAWPVMQRQGGGALLFIGASLSVRQEANPAYAAAKSGILGFAQNLARKGYPDNIRVNVIASGLIRGATETTPPATLQRQGHPRDIATAALYLVSDEAAWVTGQVLVVDGGVDMGTRPFRQFGEV